MCSARTGTSILSCMLSRRRSNLLDFVCHHGQLEVSSKSGVFWVFMFSVRISSIEQSHSGRVEFHSGSCNKYHRYPRKQSVLMHIILFYMQCTIAEHF